MPVDIAPPATHPVVAPLIGRARAAQQKYERCTQEQVDEAVLAVGWAIMEPARNRHLAEIAVRDTGLGNVPDKVRKNHRKTLGLLRDLQGARSVGIIHEDPVKGLVEIARPVGVVAAVTPSTNPGATPANKIINALKGRNAVIVAPSPKGLSTCEALVGFIHAELDRLGLPRDLVQHLPEPVTKDATQALMRAADLVVVTGSQSNVRAGYTSGTPAFGVGAGNVAAIVDETADLDEAAHRIMLSKTFDNATSCSSENSVVLVDTVYDEALAALQRQGGVLLDGAEKALLQAVMWPAGRLSEQVTARAAPVLARLAGLDRAADEGTRFLMVSEDGFGPDHPFSGEKLSPVLAVYRARDFDHAGEIVRRIYGYQGAGHSVSLHTRDESRCVALGLTLPVCRVIVNQPHCYATGGSFENGLPFSLSMGCGTWGRNNFSDNLNYRHYLNITRVARPIAPQEPRVEDIFAGYWARHGRSRGGAGPGGEPS